MKPDVEFCFLCASLCFHNGQKISWVTDLDNLKKTKNHNKVHQNEFQFVSVCDLHTIMHLRVLVWQDEAFRDRWLKWREEKSIRRPGEQTTAKPPSEDSEGHLLLLLSCALLLWSEWLGDMGSDESPPSSASKCAGPPPGALLSPPPSPPSSRDASSSGRETHLRLLPSDDCTPKTQLQEVCSKNAGNLFLWTFQGVFSHLWRNPGDNHYECRQAPTRKRGSVPVNQL